MNQVPQHLIDEATKRGIVPGAVVSWRREREFTIPPHSLWYPIGDDCIAWMRRDGAPHGVCYILNSYSYAAVITPAPSKEEGLVDGDACEPNEYMRAAIIAKAKEVGLATNESRYNCNRIGYNPDCEVLQVADRLNTYRIIPSGEFYDRLCRMKKPEPPIKIKVGEGINTEYHEVLHRSGSIKIGCTVIDNATVRSIASKLID